VTDTTPTYAVIPTEGRPCLHDCVAALADQVDTVILATNNGYGARDVSGVQLAVIEDADTESPNISRWWNNGLKVAQGLAETRRHDRWNVLVVNDDTIMAPGSVAVLTAGLRRHDGAQLAYPGPVEKVLTQPGPDRITGWCFALRGEGGLRMDEELVWWASDNSCDWSARLSGGTVVVPGVDHQHLHPNGYTVARPDLTEQAGKDMTRFVEKWGRPAW
jgi:hypothetical protein